MQKTSRQLGHILATISMTEHKKSMIIEQKFILPSIYTDICRTKPLHYTTTDYTIHFNRMRIFFFFFVHSFYMVIIRDCVHVEKYFG
jgi:hypothetical protein